MLIDDSRLRELDEPWQIAVRLAWEAYVGGNVGVGSVLTDAVGRVVAVGRNRVSDTEAPPGRLRSTYIAHAELDVMGQLLPGNYRDHTLWTTLEPCVLCSSAIVMSNIGNVTFAARDMLWDGLSRLTELNDFVASRWPVRRGPLDGPIAVFCELVPLLWFLEQKPAGSVIQKYKAANPQLLALGQDLMNSARFASLKSRPIDAVLQELWEVLARVG